MFTLILALSKREYSNMSASIRRKTACTTRGSRSPASLWRTIYGMRSETNVQALTRSEIYLCSAKRLAAFSDQQPGIARTNAEQLFLQTYSRYLDLYRLTPEERYLQLLRRCPGILQSVPLKEIASYLMITPTHMSRIRRKQSFG